MSQDSSLATSGSSPGGPERPMRLFKRLNAISMRQRARYSSPIALVEKAFASSGGDKDNPFRGGERAAQYDVAFPLCGAPCFGSRRFGRLRGLAESDETEGQRRSFFAPDPDGAVENACAFSAFESGQDIERLAIPGEPPGAFPACAHDDIGALLQDMRQRIGMHVSSIGNEDISFCDRRAAEPLAAFFIG